MLQFYVELCCSESNVVHKVRRYVPLFVASELVSDVLAFIHAKTHIASTNKELTCLLQSPLFPFPAGWCVSTGGLL